MRFVPALVGRQTTTTPTAALTTANNATVADDGLPHNDYGPQLNITIWLLSGLAAGFLALRIYCKYLRGRGLWWDDHVLILSWFVLALAAAFTSVSISFGYGKHLHDITEEQIKSMAFVANFAGTFSVLAAAWSKTSFALTLLRISERRLKAFIWFLLVSLNIVMGASALMMWIKCMPVARIWDGSIEGTCWPEQVIIIFFQFSAAYSGALDIILALIPWKIIMRLMMTKSEKFGVAFAMSMGVFAGMASFIKLTKIPSLGTAEPTETVSLVIWGAAESAITIIAASIPILRALVRENVPGPARFCTENEQSLGSPKKEVDGQGDLEMPK